jgi:hypothetical protein
MDDATRARFPDVPEAAGHYESYYMRAAHPSEPLGIWIRYTVHKRPGWAPNGSLWFTLFDGSADGPQAVKATHPDPKAGGHGYIEIAGSTFGPRGLVGEAKAETSEASWELELAEGQPQLLHLPRGWMYTARIPRTKTLSPHPGALVSGRVTVNGRTLELDRWRGMVGHNWGAEHAERWVWMHAIGFEDQPDTTWLDVAIGRVKVGPLTTPWIASGALSIAGERHALGGAERIRSTQITESPTGCEFSLPGNEIAVQGTVVADARNFVGWVYADPGGSEHNTVNCSIADMQLKVTREGSPELTLRATGGATYELGMRETDHGIPIQPYTDG